MKTFILLCGILAAVQALDFQQEYVKNFAECNSNEATKIDKENLIKANKGEPFEPGQLSAYLLCMDQKFGIQDEDGNVDAEKFRVLAKNLVVKQDSVDDIVKNCGSKPAELTAAETALHLLKCTRKYSEIKFPSLN